MTHIRSTLMAALAAVGIFASAPAFAQSAVCQDGQKLLLERQGLVKQFTDLTGGGKKKNVDPRPACTILTKMAANGETTLKWMSTNKDWCQVPDQAVESFTEDNKRVQTIKGQACGAAAKVAEAEKRAKQQAQQGGNRMGGGLTGTLSVPKGAL
ncbi:hypothetical protein [Microvirga solisilvae]|uniref:hypothetical protein n=1 Tax=Microvirga solisilvae TaxID=2919498 RepID=UPI001FAEAE2D|nr:hypothetical protein [Microvirga solisilvae]